MMVDVDSLYPGGAMSSRRITVELQEDSAPPEGPQVKVGFGSGAGGRGNLGANAPSKRPANPGTVTVKAPPTTGENPTNRRSPGLLSRLEGGGRLTGLDFLMTDVDPSILKASRDGGDIEGDAIPEPRPLPDA